MNPRFEHCCFRTRCEVEAPPQFGSGFRIHASQSKRQEKVRLFRGMELDHKLMSEVVYQRFVDQGRPGEAGFHCSFEREGCFESVFGKSTVPSTESTRRKAGFLGKIDSLPESRMKDKCNRDGYPFHTPARLTAVTWGIADKNARGNSIAQLTSNEFYPITHSMPSTNTPTALSNTRVSREPRGLRATSGS